MRQSERDGLLERQAQATERVADELERRRRERAEAQADHDSRRPLRRIFTGRALIRSLPQFALLWTNVVPADRVLEAYDRDGAKWLVVACSCGEQTVLSPGSLGECPGCPCRHFFHAGRDVRYRDFPVESAA